MDLLYRVLIIKILDQLHHRKKELNMPLKLFELVREISIIKTTIFFVRKTNFCKKFRPMGCNGIFQKTFVPWDVRLAHGIWDCPIPCGALLSKYDTEDNLFFSICMCLGKPSFIRSHVSKLEYINISKLE
jgi:hypothetical protein